MRFLQCRPRTLLLLLPFLLAGLSDDMQSQAAPPDIYANLLGDWVGYEDLVVRGAKQHTPVELVITRKQDSVQMDYAYGIRGHADFDEVTKFMTLDRPHAELIFRYNGLYEHREKYKVDGLDDFARTGLGSFSAFGAAVGMAGGNGMLVLELHPQTLTYQWLNETTPGRYVPVSTFSFHRQ